MRRRLLGSAILTALGLAGCNAILGLDGDTMIGGASPQGDASPDVLASNDDGGIDASVDPRLDAGSDVFIDDTPIGLRLAVGDLGGAGNADGPANDARFTDLNGIVVDKEGHRYVIDGAGTVVRKIDPNGDVTTFAGKWGIAGDANGTRGDARFSSLTAIAYDGDQTLYVTEGGDARRVRSIGLGEQGEVQTLPLPNIVSVGDQTPGAIGIAVGQVSDNVDTKVLFVSDPPTIRLHDLSARADEWSTLCGENAAGEPIPTPSDGPCTAIRIDAFDLASNAASLYFRQKSTLYRLDVPTKILEPVPFDGELFAVLGSGLTVVDGPKLVFGQALELMSVEPSSKAVVIAGSQLGWRDGSFDQARFEGIRGVAAISGKEATYAIADTTTVRTCANTNVSTLAGRGLARDDVDGVGVNARIGKNVGLTRTQDGLVYIYDKEHATVRSYDPKSGAVVTIAGREEGALPKDGGILFDGEQLLLSAARKSSQSVQRIDPATHAITTLTTTFSFGSAFTSDLKGTVFFASSEDQAISTWMASSTEKPATIVDARFKRISGLCYDASLDALVVADANTLKLSKVMLREANEVIPIDVPTAMFSSLDAIACDGSGLAYLNDIVAGTILRVNIGTGATTTVAGVPGQHGILLGSLPGRLNRPLGPLWLPNGHLLVASEAEAAIVDIHLAP